MRMKAWRQRKARRERLPRTEPWEGAGLWILTGLLVSLPLALLPTARDPTSVKVVLLAVGVPALVGVVGVCALRLGRIRYLRAATTPAAYSLLLVGLVSGAFSSYRLVAFAELARLAGWVGIYLVSLVLLTTRPAVYRLLKGWTAATLLVSLYGVLQHFHVDPIWRDEPMRRVWSTLGNATYLASFLTLMLPLQVALTLRPPGTRKIPVSEDGANPEGDPGWRARAPYAVTALLCLVCLVWASTRGAWGGLVVGCIIVGAALARRRRLGRGLLPGIRKGRLAVAIVVIAALLLVAAAMLPSREKARLAHFIRLSPSTGDTVRLAHWNAALSLFSQHMALGSGPGTFRVNSAELLSKDLYRTPGTREQMFVPGYAHNFLLQTLSDTGVIGLGALLWLIGALTLMGLRTIVRSKDDQLALIAAASTTGVLAVLVQNLTGVTFYITDVAACFWSSLALIAAAKNIGSNDPGNLVERRLAFGYRRLVFPAAVMSLGAVCVSAGIAVSWVGSQVALRRAEIAVKKGQREEALAAVERAVALNPYSFLAHYTAGFVHQWAGDDMEAAMQSYLTAGRLLPGIGSIHYNLGVCYMTSGQAEEALEEFKKAADLIPNATYYEAVAKACASTGRLEEALAAARLAIEAGSFPPERWMFAADVVQKMEKPEDAMELLREGIATRGDWVEARVGLGKLLFSRQRYKEACEEFERALRLDSESAEAWHGLGGSKFQLREFKESQSLLERASRLAPDEALVKVNLARSLMKNGEIRRARSLLADVVSAGPDTEEGVEARSMLDAGRGPGASATPGESSRGPSEHMRLTREQEPLRPQGPQ